MPNNESIADWARNCARSTALRLHEAGVPLDQLQKRAMDEPRHLKFNSPSEADEWVEWFVMTVIELRHLLEVWPVERLVLTRDLKGIDQSMKEEIVGWGCLYANSIDVEYSNLLDLLKDKKRVQKLLNALDRAKVRNAPL